MNKVVVENGVQLVVRLNQHTNLIGFYPKLLRENGPNAGDVIQVCGAPGAGKSTLLMEMLAYCTLPAQYKGVALPGRNTKAIIVSTDGHFDVFRFVSLLEAVVDGCNANVHFSLDTKMAIIKGALRNLTISYTFDQQQEELTFRNIKRMLLEDHSLGLVVIDGLSAQYWVYRQLFGIVSWQLYNTRVLDQFRDAAISNAVLLYAAEGLHADEDDGKSQCRIVMEMRRKAREMTVFRGNRIVSKFVYRIDQNLQLESVQIMVQ